MRTKMTKSTKPEKIDFVGAFKEYARKELEFIKTSDPNKIYHRVLPNFKDKDRGSIDFLYKKIIVSGSIYKDLITLEHIKVTKEGNEKDIPEVLEKIRELEKSGGDMHIKNNIK